jgi:hypothetical protein
LQTSDSELLEKARAVLASWPASPQARMARHWTVDVRDGVYHATTSAPGGDEQPCYSGTRAATLQFIEFDAVRELLECPEDILGLHGGLLAHPCAGGRGVSLIGPCFAGKSTLSCALWHSGWSFLSDDITMFNSDGTAFPSPRRASLRETSRALIGDELWAKAQITPSCDPTESGVLFHPYETDGRERPAHTELGAIVFLARRSVSLGPAQLALVNPAQAAIALLPFSNLLQRMSFPQALGRMAPIAERVPVYDIGRGPLPDMIAAVNSLVV